MNLPNPQGNSGGQAPHTPVGLPVVTLLHPCQRFLQETCVSLMCDVSFSLLANGKVVSRASLLVSRESRTDVVAQSPQLLLL